MDLQTIVVLVLVPIITALFTSSIWQLIAQRRKTHAEVVTEEETAKKVKAETDKIRSEAAQIIQDSSGDLVMEYKKQLQDMKEERISDRKQFQEERANDKRKFEEELYNIKRQLTARINKLEDELTEAYIKIDQQSIIISDLNHKILELSK